MAAYAALNSLMYILQQIQNHPRPPITLQKQHMDSLSEVISYLQDFLEKHSHRDMGDIKEALESQIADAAYAAEDVIETHIVDQILAKSNFQEDNNFINQIRSLDRQTSSNSLFCRGVKKMIRILTCSPDHQTVDGERNCDCLFCQDLQKVIEDMYLIKKEVIEIQEKIVGINDDQPPRHIISVSANISGSSAVPPPKRKNTNTMVGFDDVLIQIMDRLTGHPPNLHILPIVGMGGIGKTTLARHAYDNPLIVHHFHIRIWITISQEYRLREILLRALSCHQNDENESSEDELGDQLYKRLCGRRYLIILDDMWSIEAWENLMLFFPDNNNGSRIVITTRLSNVAKYFGSSGVKMNFLDEDKSWKLLCKIVFPIDQCCPLELEKTGKKIARNCKGLPLSIVVIAGLLANSGITQQHWEYVEKNLNSMVNLEDDQYCLKILYLSYNHLPIHLKPCFLYMGVYPEDSIILVSKLIRLWVSEGFLKPIKNKSLEVVAEDYLNELCDRNLILIHKLGSNGEVIKYCKIHDLLRDLCVREGEKDKFVWMRTVYDFEPLQAIQTQRRVSIYETKSKRCHPAFPDVIPPAPLARSLNFNSQGTRRLSSDSMRLMRVYKIETRYDFITNEPTYFLSDNIFKLVNLRYFDGVVDLKSYLVATSTIHQLWNLQTLIIYYGYAGEPVKIPPEIWEMPQLRHLEIRRWFLLPHPPNVPLIHEGDDEDFILRNLHTVKGVVNLKLSEEVIKRIPNVKKLHVNYVDFYEGSRWQNCCLNNLGLLNKLESLYIDMLFVRSGRIEFVQNLAFPHSLKKLTLSGASLHWEGMRIIGSLPHLQVLKLIWNIFLESIWNPVEGEFLCLKFLLIGYSQNLVYWNANSTHFPCLKKLHLHNLTNLKEIPLDVGHISTLQLIRLRYCSDSAVMSAKKLLDEQVELGNEDLQVLF